MRYKITMSVFIVFLTFACRRADNSIQTENCKYGKPEAIFKAEQSGISAHAFKLQNNEGVEQVKFANGIELTLIQSGCDHIRQEFQFLLPGAPPIDEPAYWIAQTINSMRMLGSFGPDFQVFSVWSQEIENQVENIKLAESIELQQGFFVRIDRILGSNNATLVLILSDVP
ncbi:MAG: hypothetical protein SFU99_08655 [Saprospiraceae bacterium]|nr:hypothetical protein [Saprospiraceae bacterium]